MVMREQTVSTPKGGYAPTSPSFHFRYSTVEGYFLQDDASTDPTGFDFVKAPQSPTHHIHLPSH